MHGLQCVEWDVNLIEGSEISFRGICLFVSRFIYGLLAAGKPSEFKVS